MNKQQLDTTDKYQLLDVISDYDYKVIRGIDKKTDEKVIIKQMPTHVEFNGLPSIILREITILKQLNHPNIIGIREIYFTKNELSNRRLMRIVYENMATDLRSYMTRAKEIQFPLIRSYAFQLLCGIAYIHSKGFIHRGITPSNILINATGFLKLSGFSNSRPYSIPESAATPEATFIFYRAPEALIEPTNYGTAADIWSAGCVIGELFTRNILFPGDSPIDQIMRIFNVLGTPSEDEYTNNDNLLNLISSLPKCPPGDLNNFFLSSYKASNKKDNSSKDDNITEDIGNLFFDLLKRMLVFDPNRRITAIEAIEHPFFDSIPKQLSEICKKDISV